MSNASPNDTIADDHGEGTTIADDHGEGTTIADDFGDATTVADDFGDATTVADSPGAIGGESTAASDGLEASEVIPEIAEDLGELV